MRKINTVILIFLGLLTKAQDYNFKSFSVEEGLSQPYVYDIVQSNSGSIYIATGDGLGEYNGNKFTTYKTKVGLAENFCTALFYDFNQTLWIGHLDGGITYCKNSVFYKVQITEAQLSKVIAFSESKDQRIYYATVDGKLYIIKNNKPELFTQEQLPSINKIKIKGDLLYVATAEGLYYLELNNPKALPVIIAGTKDKNITCFDFNSQEQLFVGIDGEGVEVLKKVGNNYSSIYSFTKNLISKKYEVKDLLLFKDNQLWISLKGEGLRMISFDADFKIQKLNVINDKNGLKSVFIRKIFKDKEGNLWFGSIGNGLFQFLSDRFEFYNKNNFLPFDNIKSIAVDDSDNVIMTDEKQLFWINSLKKSRSNVITLFDSTSENEIRTSYVNKFKSVLLIGTTNGIFIYERKNKKFNFLKKLPEFETKIINYITINLQNQYVVCTTAGLYYLDQDFKIEKELSTNNGLPHNNVTGCFADRSERLWVFSPETPLYNIYLDSIDLVKEIDSVSAFKFTVALQDKDNNIWFGTEGNGIFCLNHNQKYIHYNANNGLRSDYVYELGISFKGDIIACHKNGMSIKYHSIKNFRSITKEEGLPASSFNSKCLVSDNSGGLWMGTTEGLIKYNPIEDKINVQPPVFNFLSVSFNNIEKNVNDSVFNLSHGDYELNVDYIGVSLSDPASVTYRYKLDGFDTKWQITNSPVKNYSKLSDGEYRFIIYSTNSDGFENPEPHFFKVVIAAPFWKKAWFYVILLAITLLIFYYILRWRLFALKKAKENLEVMVTEKTKELVVEKENVEKSNKLLEKKNEDITSSITYAKRIQNATLSSVENITEKLNAFILFRPRDIVSGDFYWCYETNEHIYIAAVDCTGHGVPGAFMSLIGSTFLNQIMIENREPTPSQILFELDKKLFFSFKQKNKEEQIRDGMDMAICRINRNKQEVIFSGANRPFYIFSNNTLAEVTANLQSIGGFLEGNDKKFEDSKFNYQKSDTIYLFSDGFGDQFGGPKNKRFSMKKMKALFEQINGMEIDEQYKAMVNEHELWKMDNSQIDDILVIGIKL